MPRDVSGRTAVLGLLAGVRRRRTALDVCVCVTAAVISSSGSYGAARALVGPSGGALALSLAVGSLVGWQAARRRRDRWTPGAAAVDVERTRPECRNLVITAEEIIRHPERASDWISACVHADAAAATHGLRPADVIPARGLLAACAGVLLLAASMVFLTGPAPDGKLAATSSGPADGLSRLSGRSAFTITVRPPAYVSAEPKTIRNPERLDVLQGSRLTLDITGGEPHRVRFGSQLLGDVAGSGSVELLARDSGYFAIEDRHGGRRLVAVAVTPDRLPIVRVDQPAKDLLLPDASPVIQVRVTAFDDIGLQQLELRYTKVSGTGEQFEFVEGRLPINLNRSSPREWRGDMKLVLQSLALEPGDSLVYRAVATDARPGAEGIAASDTYFIEIAGPGQVALEGVDMPPEEERYALSQQMIVLKIERLRAKERTLSRERVADQTADIAAEQRAVRANFVFLLGGHVEDEEVEAEQSSEISEGRLQNTARRDVNAAIREMTRAEQGLVAVDTGVALPPARAAVAALQRAFGKSRYLLRALPGTGRIDPARRLAGVLATANTWRRDPPETPPRDGAAARALLREVTGISAAVQIETTALEHLAERALALDPTSSSWQEISQRLLQLRTADTTDARRAQLDALVVRLQAEAQRGLLPRTGLSDAVSPLRRSFEKER
jgi:hypothetical protein